MDAPQQLCLPPRNSAQAHIGEKTAGVVEKLNQVFEKHVLAEQGQKGQSQGVTRNSDQGLGGILETVGWVFVKVAAAEQRALQKITAVAPRGRDDFVNGGFVAPDEGETLLHHAAEKVDIFSRSGKLRAKKDFDGA